MTNKMQCCDYHTLNGNTTKPCSKLDQNWVNEISSQIAINLKNFGYEHASNDFVSTTIRRILDGSEKGTMGSRKMIKTMLLKALDD